MKATLTLSLSLLSSLLWTAMGQTTPTTAPEDYRLTIRSPSGCVPSECSYFAGVQTNEGDATFLDFYLEGAATGWVAIGVSDSASMFSTDVLGCNVFGGTVVAKDTWNMAANTRLNSIDPTQDGLVEHSSSFVDSRITCSFSRSIAVTDSGRDLDLDGDYFVLYGTSNVAATSAGSGLAVHSFSPTPRISLNRMNLVTDVDPTPPPVVLVFVPPPAPTRAPDDSRLIVSSDPGACDSSTCDLFVGISTNEDNSSFFDFYIEGEADGWVAVGFSETQDMFSSDVLGCNLISGTTTVDVVDTWNLARSQSRLNTIDSTQEGLFLHSSSVIDGRISCSFSRYTDIVNSGQDLDLADGEYFILFGVGQSPTSAAGSALATHRPQSNPRLTGRVNILEDSGVVGAEITTRERLVRAHGILMIIAWPVLAVTAIFFAAWMKPALPNGEWFQVHRAFMIASLFVGAAGFLLIFVAFRDGEQPGLITFSDNSTGTAHFIIGIIVMALHITNPIIAIFRCKPDGKRRWIFNLLHASTIGLLVQILALTNIGLGTSIFSRTYSQFLDLTIFWVYIGYIIFFNILIVGLFILFAVLAHTGDGEDRAKTAPSLLKYRYLRPSSTSSESAMVELPASPDKKEPAVEEPSKTPPERKPPSKDAPIRWVALAVYLAVMVPMMFTLIVLIALDP